MRQHRRKLKVERASATEAPSIQECRTAHICKETNLGILVCRIEITCMYLGTYSATADCVLVFVDYVVE